MAADRRTLYVSDLDGTLLRPDGTLGDFTAAVVNELVAGGGLFTYATARSPYRAALLTQSLNLQLPLITYGGAVITDPVTSRTLRTATPPAAAVRTLITAAARRGLQPLVFVQHAGRDRLCWIDGPLNWGTGDFLRRRTDDPRLLPLASWSQVSLEQVFYISLIGPLTDLEECRSDLVEELADCDVLISEDVYVPGQFILDLTSAAGTKAAALQQVAAEVKADEVVCFGDNVNDLGMFGAADRSYAVANAVAEARRVATAVIGSNAVEGVARWLREHAA
ncbi:hypothetical protein SAMN05892883_4000 [Jatrophihabitans sp. GAS493]|uniref:HAD hydrolase family protein n=1 Tax=Jatrophihabitans sp. GAS493 TaxID=1907575 RepID=UPI000BC02D71|nr:HAD hydrolase family protein [Jatrophihabitans sp. GAS493]SOD74808.1 hypothetical protein SAMN05892883_4000 [Jatrophihabitans sp. GAS493]